jgi:Domain of unknown function (DUF4105)
VACLLALIVPRHACAAPAPPTRVSVLTMGPGDHPFTRFGHNAILLEWDRGGYTRSQVYNFGTFEFDGLQGVTDFMAGRFRYWLSVTNLDTTVRAYAAANRSLTAQELELTPDERAELATALVENARPEHRYYDYDYYRDNCSTRVRDAIDRVVGGELRRSVVGAGKLSFRQHTLRLVGDSPWLYFGLDVALGAPTDRPTTRWDELFLPQELHDALSHAWRTLGAKRVPLVKTERSLHRADRQPLPSAASAAWLAFLGCGTGLGLLFAGLGWGARKRFWRVAFGVVTALSGLAFGLLGTALAIFTASKHWAAHANPSLLGCPPWSLALVVFGSALALGRGPLKSLRRVQLVLMASLASSLMLLMVALCQNGHASLRMAALFVPLWAGAWWGARLASRAHATPTPR